MRILAVINGKYGKRIVKNLKAFAPSQWKINVWEVSLSFPPIIEEPEEFLPEDLPSSDLIISLGELPQIAELIPELTKLTGAKAVILPCDNRDWLPSGLGNQIKKELGKMGVDCALPSPFCSLTRKGTKNKYITSFAKYFGKPEIEIFCKEGKIDKVKVTRQAPCGATLFIAEKLKGVKVEEAEEKAALFHHYYPCLASGKIENFKDSILHTSANLTKSIVKKAVFNHRD